MQKIIFNNRSTYQTEAILCIDSENKKLGLVTRANKTLKNILNNIIYNNGLKLFVTENTDNIFIEKIIKIDIYEKEFINALYNSLKDNWNIECVESNMEIAEELKL